RSAARHRVYRARRGTLPGLSNLVAPRAAEGQGARSGSALLSRRTRRRRGAPLHGRLGRRAQLQTEDLLRNEPDMTATNIRDLFATDIERNIEEVIKVDQTDEQLVREELAEYVATDSIRSHFRTILDRYAETPNKPHEGIGVWVSGFFGSGKSSFAK